MYDPRAPSSLRALAEYGKPEIARKLLKYAMWRTQSLDEAKDLVADALVRVCDPEDKPWDPSARSFFRHMRRVMSDDAIEAARTGFGKYETVDSEHEAFERVVEPTPAPDVALHAARKLGWLREMMQTLLARITRKDPLSTAIYRLACENRHEEPAEFAEALAVPVEEIYEAMRRMRYHGTQVRAEWEDKEAARMAELRGRSERARKKERP